MKKLYVFFALGALAAVSDMSAMLSRAAMLPRVGSRFASPFFHRPSPLARRWHSVNGLHKREGELRRQIQDAQKHEAILDDQIKQSRSMIDKLRNKYFGRIDAARDRQGGPMNAARAIFEEQKFSKALRSLQRQETLAQSEQMYPNLESSDILEWSLSELIRQQRELQRKEFWADQARRASEGALIPTRTDYYLRGLLGLGGAYSLRNLYKRYISQEK